MLKALSLFIILGSVAFGTVEARECRSKRCHSRSYSSDSSCGCHSSDSRCPSTSASCPRCHD